MSTIGRSRGLYFALFSIASCTMETDPFTTSQDPGGPRPGYGMMKPSYEAGAKDANKPGRPDAGDSGSKDVMAPPADGDSGAPPFPPCTFISVPGTPMGVCLPLAPFAWVGPGRLLTAESPADLPACAGMTPQEFAMGSILGEQPSACQACTCDAPRGLSCGLGSAVDLYFDKDCVDPCTAQCLLCESSCVSTQSSCAFHGTLAEHLLLKRPQLASGSCHPSAPPSPPAPVIDQAARACLDGLSPQGVSCAPGQSCVASGVSGKVCLFHRGDDLACPRGPYTERSVFFSRIDDTRTCKDCSCSSPTGVDCPSRLQLFETPMCSGEITKTFDTNKECLDLGALKDAGGGFEFLPADPIGKGSCVASGTAKGSVTGNEPFTACCIPDGTTSL